MSIHQRDFNLCKGEEGRKLLLELYNLRHYYEEFKKRIDPIKVKMLKTLNEKAKDLDTVTKAAKSRSARAKEAKSKGGAPGHLTAIPEGQIDAFVMEEIQEILHISGVGEVFPLAMVRNSDMGHNTLILITMIESLSGKNVVQ